MNRTCPLITQTSIASQRQRFAVQYVRTFLPGEHPMHALSLAHPARRREAPVTRLGNISMTSNVHAFERVKLRRTERPDRAEVEAAFRTIIRWTGDDPDRDGLTETPARLARAFEEFFVGYSQDPAEILQKTFEEIEGYVE